MTMDTEMVETIVKVVKRLFVQAIKAVSLVASVSCPSIGGTSLSAVSPDNDFIKETALAGA